MAVCAGCVLGGGGGEAVGAVVEGGGGSWLWLDEVPISSRSRASGARSEAVAQTGNVCLGKRTSFR